MRLRLGSEENMSLSYGGIVIPTSSAIAAKDALYCSCSVI